jgi:Hemerythrin HHE cation binding domain
MAEENILDLMVSHHTLIETMFVVFRDEARQNSPEKEASLSELAWEVKKHFFTEENAIFNLPQIKDMGVFKIIEQLKKEHIIMLSSLERFSKNLPDINNDEMEEFHKLLESHRKIEEVALYPKLDKELQESQKKQVIFRIDEIPINIDSNK